ncbi:MAG: GIY-YIG nuclease family protein [Porticoccaceae bacterium]
MADGSVVSWQVYMIEASDGSLYTGIATDLARRFDEHASGRGAKYFNTGRKPLRVVYSETAEGRSAAQVREAGIKRLSRVEKLALVVSETGLVGH